MPIALAALLLARPTKILLFFLLIIDSSLPHRPLHRHSQATYLIFLSLARDVPAALQRRPSKSIELESNPCLRDPALLLNCEVFLDSLLPGRTSVVHYTRLTDTTRHNNTAAAPGQRFTRTASSTACPSQRLSQHQPSGEASELLAESGNPGSLRDTLEQRIPLLFVIS